MPNSICLETNRLRIRDPLISDLPGWHKLMSDAETMYYLADIIVLPTLNLPFFRQANKLYQGAA
jgi:hypothetical protein